jgi:hypothetical protein
MNLGTAGDVAYIFTNVIKFFRSGCSVLVSEISCPGYGKNCIPCDLVSVTEILFENIDL